MTSSDLAIQTTVLIPAAGRVADGVLALSNISCPAMVPVGGRPVIYWTMSYLRSLGLKKFKIAVSRRGLSVEDFVECTFGGDCEVEFIVPEVDEGVGRTIYELARHATTQSALVVLGDTHFQFADPEIVWTDQPAVLVSQVEDSYRWCIAEINDKGIVASFIDKQPDVPGQLNALIGVYYFPSLEQLQIAAETAVHEAEQTQCRSEISHILRVAGRKSPIRALKAGDWLDCGNPDRQASSHRVMLQKREFNELQIDPIFGTVTKRSRNTEKFLDEINYLRLLPAELAVLFPRVVASSTDWSDPYLTMEYYGYPTLAEAFVFENVNPSLWEHIFLHLRDILVKGFMRYRRPLSSSSVRQMYVDKTLERLSNLNSLESIRCLVESDHVTINGRRTASLRTLWSQIEDDVTSLGESKTGCVIHGDLCLSNVLYDLRSRIVKLIDPRGSFGQTGIYGDPRYDVAKLYHSTHGFYDFIVNDLFEVNVDGNHVSLDIHTRPQHDEIRRRFEQVFFPEFNRREVTLITGLLFASMPSLHYDAPKRQVAMYVRSLQLLNEVYGTDEGTREAKVLANADLY